MHRVSVNYSIDKTGVDIISLWMIDLLTKTKINVSVILG